MALGVDPYSVLGVSRDATDKQIARARHRLVLRYHPDVNPAPDAAARFDEVQQAFHLLSDPAARAESDRAHEEQGQARPAQRSGTVTGTGIFVQPGTVDFGWLVPGLPGADGKVAVTWTGAPPSHITSKPGGEWWTNRGTTRLASSGVVFYLHAQAPAEAPDGHWDDEFTVTLDGTAVTVPLTADTGLGFPPEPSVIEAMGFTWARLARVSWLAGGFLLLYLLLSLLGYVH